MSSSDLQPDGLQRDGCQFPSGGADSAPVADSAPAGPAAESAPAAAPERGLIPIYDETEPLVCTIEEAEIPDRIELLERMRRELTRLERTEHGLLLHFPTAEDVEADLHRFAVDEKRCCQFWGFEVSAADDDLTLRWDGPPDAGLLLDRLESWFRGDEPITALSGLL